MPVTDLFISVTLTHRMIERRYRTSSRLIDAWTDEAADRTWFLFGACWE